MEENSKNPSTSRIASKEALEDQLLNLKGRNYYQEFEDKKKANQGVFEKIKSGLMLKQSMRKKETILPIVEKIEQGHELSGLEKAQVIDAIRHKMSVDEIKFLEEQKRRFMWHSILSTGTSLTSCFIFSVLSKKYVNFGVYLKVPVNIGIFLGSIAFTMSPAFDELGNFYGQVLQNHQTDLNRQTICAYFEIDKEADYNRMA